MKDKKPLFSLVVALFFLPLICFSQYQVTRGFMPNVGQLYDQSGKPNVEVRFAHFTNGLNVLVNDHGFSYDVWTSDSLQTQYHRIDFSLVNCMSPLKWQAVDQWQGTIQVVDPYTPTTTHAMGHYGKLVARNVYANIDLEMMATPDGTKYNFILHPGAHLNEIQMEILGAPTSIKDGSIWLQTRFGSMEENVPLSFCQENGRPIKCGFEALGTNRFGLAILDNGIWNSHSETLVIDPVPNRLWGSYWGSSSLEFVYGLTEDNLSNVYVCGVGTGGLSFTTAGAYQTVMVGPANDAFIFKFNSSGIIQWCTYYGGNNGETARAISASGTGDLYVVGFTDSTTGIASAGAFRTSLAGGTDSFLVKFTAAGGYVWGTYIGGTSEDYLRAVHYDATTDVVIVGGHTKSASQSTTGSHQAAHAGLGDGYLASFSSGGARNWSTYYGGTAEDIINGVHLTSAGVILAGGSTASTTGIATAGVHQSSIGGATDGFLATLTTAGARTWGSYFGGTGTDIVKAVKISFSGKLVGVGDTSSGTGIASALAHQTTLGGGNDAFVTVLETTGSLSWSTYYGGTANDAGNAVAIDTTNNVYLVGNTVSSSGISTVGAYQTASAGGLDGYIAQFTKLGLRNWGTYYGGSGSETVNCGVVNLALQLHIAGHSTSSSGITTAGTSQVNHTSGINDDPFIVKFGELMLPIELGDVSAACQDGNWRIHWQTISENYTDYFEVHWAKDLSNWQLCERVSAMGHSLEVQSYSIEGTCVPDGSGYFQILLVNTDGSRETVHTGALNCESGDELLIAPNPTADIFKVIGAMDYCLVYDSFGKLIGRFKAKGANMALEIDASTWANGVYLIHAVKESDVQTRRLVVHHN
jgi:hypothetical protein